VDLVKICLISTYYAAYEEAHFCLFVFYSMIKLHLLASICWPEVRTGSAICCLQVSLALDYPSLLTTLVTSVAIVETSTISKLS